jgi:tripartite-type tricarboxylate transporter receptor subunit TctC
MKQCFFALWIALVSTLTTGVVSAQPFPNKPIRLVVPFAPGGGSDTVGRLLAQRLSETLGVSVVVDNKPGAAGVLGTEIVARAPADGYTLLLADSPHTFNHLVLTKVPYDPLKDFRPIAVVARTPLVLAVPVKFAAQSAREFITMAKSQPGQLSMGSGGNGSIAHLAQELFKMKSGVQLIHIPYKGSGPAINDVVGGQIQAILTPAPGVVPQVQGGKLRALAVTAAKRSTVMPDAPTFTELGLAELEIYNWYGVLAPAQTPPEVIAKLSDAIRQVMAMAAVQERLTAQLLEPINSTPQDFKALLERDTQTWANIVKGAQIKPE